MTSQRLPTFEEQDSNEIVQGSESSHEGIGDHMMSAITASNGFRQNKVMI